jgi:transcription elongation factor Elf1
MVDENKQNKLRSNLEGFLITCPDCEANKIEHNTMLYVDWDKHFYKIYCQTCGKIVYFDYCGKIVPRDIAKDMYERTNQEKFIN